VLDPDVREETAEAWKRAYERQSATRGDEAVCWLTALFERAA
jgi:hypothetical protein